MGSHSKHVHPRHKKRGLSTFARRSKNRRGGEKRRFKIQTR